CAGSLLARGSTLNSEAGRRLESIGRCRPIDFEEAFLDAGEGGSLSDWGAEAALQQASVSEPLRVRSEGGGGAAPTQLVDIAEERRVGSERRQVLEPQRQIAIPQDAGREALESAVAVEELCRRLGADPGNAWIAICGVADESQKIGDQDGG